MQNTQRFIIVCIALLIGIGVGFSLSTLIQPDFAAAPVVSPELPTVLIENATATNPTLLPVEPPQPVDQAVADETDALIEVPAEPETPLTPEDAVMCTMDAKICPDGSGVGRVPPSCAFAPCPGE